MTSTQDVPVAFPRVAITYCTQCRWMLRAAYFGQELLSTFGTQIGEIALIPATGGLFTVELMYKPPEEVAEAQPDSLEAKVLEFDVNTGTYAPPKGAEKEVEGGVGVKKVLLWDRKAEGGFPETKVLKQRVRDRIDPKRDLGHSDVGGKKKESEVAGREERTREDTRKETGTEEVKRNPDGTVCEDCR